MRTIVPILSCVLFIVSCATKEITSRWSPWLGAQIEQPVSPGEFAHQTEGVEIYDPGHFPARPYSLLGQWRLEIVFAEQGETIEQAVARGCRLHGADGAIRVHQKFFGTQGAVLIFNLFKYTSSEASKTTAITTQPDATPSPPTQRH